MPSDIAGYSNLKSIGYGGSGVVYTAFDETHNRTVAIKVLMIGNLESGGQEVFTRELQTMGSVADHPNVVSLYHSGFTEEGQPYLVMPLYPKGSIREWLREHGAIESSRVRTFSKQATLGLQAAHRAGVLHCDIKPGNIMINNFDDQPVLGDFGVARAINSVKPDDQVSCTLNYAAPEILAGNAQTKQSDIYSLGATLYAIAAGRIPFRAANPQEMARKILNEEPAPMPAEIPADVRQVILRMIDPDPERRPQSCDEILRVLEEPEEDATDTSMRSAFLVGAGLTALVLLLGLVAIFWPDPEPQVASPAPQPTSAWLVVDRADDISVRLEGSVKTESEKEALVNAATATGLIVDADAVAVLPDIDDTSTFAIAKLLEELVNGSDDGQIVLGSETLTVTGEAYDPIEAEEIRAAIEEVEETGLAVDDRTTVQVLSEDVQIVKLQNEINQIFELSRAIEGQSPNFEVSDGVLSDGAKGTLDRVSVAMRRYPLPSADIVGHTDDVGTAEANQVLSEERSKAVHDYLVESGIDSDRLTAVGLGESEPVADNTTEEGRNENRRVDFTIKSSGG